MSDVISQDMVLDDLDQRLVHAVQVSPRIPWSAIAGIVGADAVTLGRRWARLQEAGLVYVTGYNLAGGLRSGLALIDVECVPGSTLQVANALAADRETVTIDLTAGGRDLVVTLAADWPSRLAEWTLERIRGVADVRSMRTHVVAGLVTDASSWRLRALSHAEVAAIKAIRPSKAPPMPNLSAEQLCGVYHALGADGRSSTAVIAERAGITPRKAREAVAALTATGRLGIRVDVARIHTPWPVYAWYYMRVPPAMVGRVGPALSRIEEVRVVANTIGPYNVIMAVWLRTLNDVGRLEVMLAERLPGLEIVDRSVVLRIVKHMGHLLDDQGCATGRAIPLPLDPSPI